MPTSIREVTVTAREAVADRFIARYNRALSEWERAALAGEIDMGIAMPKIPSPEEIAQTTRTAMQPMMDELVAIKDLIEELVELQREQSPTKARKAS